MIKTNFFKHRIIFLTFAVLGIAILLLFSSLNIYDKSVNAGCTPGIEQSCKVGDCEGTQQCQSNGTWGSCTKNNLCCGVTCKPGEECVNGICGYTCTSGSTKTCTKDGCPGKETCSGDRIWSICVKYDLCCGVKCESGYSCSSGACVTACSRCSTADCGACSSMQNGYRCVCSGKIGTTELYSSCVGVLSDCTCCQPHPTTKECCFELVNGVCQAKKSTIDTCSSCTGLPGCGYEGQPPCDCGCVAGLSKCSNQQGGYSCAKECLLCNPESTQDCIVVVNGVDCSGTKTCASNGKSWGGCSKTNSDCGYKMCTWKECNTNGECAIEKGEKYAADKDCPIGCKSDECKITKVCEWKECSDKQKCDVEKSGIYPKDKDCPKDGCKSDDECKSGSEICKDGDTTRCSLKIGDKICSGTSTCKDKQWGECVLGDPLCGTLTTTTTIPTYKRCTCLTIRSRGEQKCEPQKFSNMQPNWGMKCVAEKCVYTHETYSNCRIDDDCKTFLACDNEECIRRPGKGPDQCQTNADCLAKSHYECIGGGACRLQFGAGINDCIPKPDACPSYYKCNDKKQCVLFYGSGENQCKNDYDCGSAYYQKCEYGTDVYSRDGLCVKAYGAGTNQCNSTVECDNKFYHLECNVQKQCVSVKNTIRGNNSNQCSTDCDCGAPCHTECHLTESRRPGRGLAGELEESPRTKTQSCILIPGIGANECETNTDCQFYFKCQNQKCVKINKAGINQCSSDNECVTHLECRQYLCQPFLGPGPDKCKKDSDCGKLPPTTTTTLEPYHTKIKCMGAIGAMPDECGSSPCDCGNPCHKECRYPPPIEEAGDELGRISPAPRIARCIEVEGEGPDKCNTNADCQALKVVLSADKFYVAPNETVNLTAKVSGGSELYSEYKWQIADSNPAGNVIQCDLMNPTNHQHYKNCKKSVSAPAPTTTTTTIKHRGQDIFNKEHNKNTNHFIGLISLIQKVFAQEDAIPVNPKIPSIGNQNTIQYSWGLNGKYDINVTVIDSNGTSAKSNTLTITVGEPEIPPLDCNIASFNINNKTNEIQDPLIFIVNSVLKGYFSIAGTCVKCTVSSNDTWGNPPKTYPINLFNSQYTETFKINTPGDYSFSLTCQGEDPEDIDIDNISLRAVKVINLPWWREIIPYLQGFLRGLGK